MWHHCPTVLWSGLSQNVAMIDNMGANMGLLMSQPSISVSTTQQKCPTVMKAIHHNPTQYASISIQVHSPLLTAIETGLLECDQVASTPIIHYITEDHWSNNNIIPGFQHSRRYSNMHSGRSRSTSYYNSPEETRTVRRAPLFFTTGGWALPLTNT